MLNFIKRLGHSLGLIWAIAAASILIAYIGYFIKYQISERLKGLAYDREKINKLFYDLHGVDTSKCKIIFKSFKHFKNPKHQNAYGYYDYYTNKNKIFINKSLFSKYGNRDKELEKTISHEFQHYCQYVHKKHVLVYDINHALANDKNFSYEENPLEKDSLHVEKLYEERF